MTRLLILLHNMPPLTQRAIALVLLLWMLILPFGVIWGSTWHFSSRYDHLVDLREELNLFESTIKLGDSLTALAGNIQPEAGEYFLSGASPSIVNAQLQSWIANIAQTRQLQVHSISSLLPSDTGEAPQAGLTVEYSGAWESVQSLVFEIERAKPALFVSKLELRSTDSFQGPSSESEIIVARISFFGAISPVNTEHELAQP